MSFKACALLTLLATLSPVDAAGHQLRRQGSPYGVKNSVISGTASTSTTSESLLDTTTSSSSSSSSSSPSSSSSSPSSSSSTSAASASLSTSSPSPSISLASATAPKTTFPAPSFTYAPTGHSVRPLPTGRPPPADNQTCGGETLNVLGASLDWWYSQTIYEAVSTLSIQFNSNDQQTGWTLLPATKTFDTSLAVTTDICSETTIVETQYNITYTEETCTPSALTVAASTTAIYLDAYRQINQTTGNGTTFPSIIVTPPPASATVPGSAGTYLPGTPFVYFSAYQIMSENLTTYRNGSRGCATATTVYNMSTPFAFAYDGSDPSGKKEIGAGVTGDVNPAFLGIVDKTSATAGSWVAEPTVIVVVEMIVVAQAVLAASVVSYRTSTSLDLPSATLPSYFSTVPNSALPDSATAVTATGHIEVTQSYLAIPSPSPTTSTPAAASPVSIAGNAVSAINAPQPAGSSAQSPGNAAQSPNALDVLSQALQTQPATATLGAAASAIIVGLGGTPTPNAATPAQVITAAGATATASTISEFVAGGQTALPGGAAITVSGTVISVLPSGNSIVVGGSTVAVPGSGSGTTAFTANGLQITPAPGAVYTFAGQTLVPGGAAITISGTVVSLAPGGTALVIGGSTSIIAGAAAAASPPVITIGSQTYTANSATQYVIAPGTTLTPGGSVVVSGTTISLAPGATAIVINGKTTTLAAAGSTATGKPVLTIGGQTFTAQPGSGTTYVVAGQTLTVGAVRTVTIGGSTYVISLSDHATALEIEQVGPGGSITATSYETLVVGGAIASATASGSTGSSGSSSSAAPYTGAATSIDIQMTSGVVIMLGGLLLVAWL